MKKLFLLPVLYFLLVFSAYAQNRTDVLALLGHKMGDIRNNIPVNEAISEICSTENYAIIEEQLLQYTKDSLCRVRKQAYRYLALTALNSSDLFVQQKVVNMLLASCYDSEAIVVGKSIHFLKLFPKAAFTIGAKSEIDSLLYAIRFYKNDLYRLAAMVQTAGVQRILKAKLAKVSNKTEKWNIYLALARTGDKYAADYLLYWVKRLPVANDFVYDILPGMLFTKQKVLYDYLLQLVLSDACKCTSGNPDSNRKINCAYYIIEELAYSIEDFPLALNEFEELAGELNAKSLETVRKWYAKNKSYKIK